jgi:hypothetical protein
MKNVKVTVQGNLLTITVDLTQNQGPSSSGKTDIIATTEGNISVPGREDVKLGLNIYTPRKGR